MTDTGKKYVYLEMLNGENVLMVMRTPGCWQPLWMLMAQSAMPYLSEATIREFQELRIDVGGSISGKWILRGLASLWG